MADPTVDVSPVTGLMDVRSSPDVIPFGSYRHVLNCHSVLTDKLGRMTGWEKLLSQDNYNNQDLHDQFVPVAEREPVTMIFEGISTSKNRKLYVGTSSKIYALNNSTGNWRVIAGPYSTARWAPPAQVDDTIVFTNGSDALIYHIFDQPNEANGQAALPIPDLQKLNVVAAEVVVAWKDLMILCNIVQDGQFYSNRVIWSDFKKPLSFTPSSASVAGTFDLTSGEAILAAMPLGNVLVLYTNFGIWECQAVGGDEVLSFNKRYEPHRNTTRCLAYRHTLLSIGSSHLYAGHDGIYSYDLYHIEPTLVDYIHKGSGLVYNTIDKTRCDLHCAGFNEKTKEAIFSWVKPGEAYPTASLLMNMDQAFTSELDHGFTAFGHFTAPESELSIFQYIVEHCICSTDQLKAHDLLDGNEFKSCTPIPDFVCEEPVESFYTNHELLVPLDPNDPHNTEFVPTEDYTQAEPDEGSFCALYPTLTFNELCAAEYRADECATGIRFIGASSVDFALKQLTEVYFRERYRVPAPETPPDQLKCALYDLDGYRSRVRSGAMSLGVTKHAKKIVRFEIEALSEPQTTPSLLTLRVGTAAQALDPNTASGRCAIMWEEQEPKPLDCLSEETAAQHLADGTVPNLTLEWPLFREGRYLYFEWEITNPPNDTGGAATFSRYSIDVGKETRTYPMG